MCLTKSIVYKATVVETGKFYIGLTDNEFKKRLANHKHSFTNEKERNSTTLSQHIWDSGLNPEPEIKWQILKKSQPRFPGSQECLLCLEEKNQILKHNRNPNCLNKRSELSNRCVTFHRAKHKLSNI